MLAAGAWLWMLADDPFERCGRQSAGRDDHAALYTGSELVYRGDSHRDRGFPGRDDPYGSRRTRQARQGRPDESAGLNRTDTCLRDAQEIGSKSAGEGCQ